tara:strand:+ start:6622 stop:8679 length:2058 start_codon:yes stop_codon:yes gene_type:complete
MNNFNAAYKKYKGCKKMEKMKHAEEMHKQLAQYVKLKRKKCPGLQWNEAPEFLKQGELKAGETFKFTNTAWDWDSTKSTFPQEKGSFYVEGGGHIASHIAGWMKAMTDAGARVSVSLDYHPSDHTSFGQLPPHCIMGSFGARLDRRIEEKCFNSTTAVYHKAFDKHKECYGAVEYTGSECYHHTANNHLSDNNKWYAKGGKEATLWYPTEATFDVFNSRCYETGKKSLYLGDHLVERMKDVPAGAVTKIYVCGVAGDYCVKDSCVNLIKMVPEGANVDVCILLDGVRFSTDFKTEKLIDKNVKTMHTLLYNVLKSKNDDMKNGRVRVVYMKQDGLEEEPNNECTEKFFEGCGKLNYMSSETYALKTFGKNEENIKKELAVIDMQNDFVFYRAEQLSEALLSIKLSGYKTMSVQDMSGYSEPVLNESGTLSCEITRAQDDKIKKILEDVFCGKDGTKIMDFLGSKLEEITTFVVRDNTGRLTKDTQATVELQFQIKEDVIQFKLGARWDNSSWASKIKDIRGMFMKMVVSNRAEQLSEALVDMDMKGSFVPLQSDGSYSTNNKAENTGETYDLNALLSDDNKERLKNVLRMVFCDTEDTRIMDFLGLPQDIIRKVAVLNQNGMDAVAVEFRIYQNVIRFNFFNENIQVCASVGKNHLNKVGACEEKLNDIREMFKKVFLPSLFSIR